MRSMMWESPLYKFEEEIVNDEGKLAKKIISINVTYSAPRNLNDPGKALIGVFNKITEGLKPNETKILDIGAAKLRNTLWFLEKGYQVWSIEYPELRDRLPDAKRRWEHADNYPNFHNVTSPRDFISLKEKFDIILLVNIINVMPIPLERYALLSLCREKINDNGMLLWHQWRGLAIGGEKYSEENSFIDGYLMGRGQNHSFYNENGREESHELLSSVGFAFNKTMNLHKIPANSCYSYIFNPKHEILIPNALNLEKMLSEVRDSNKIMPIPKSTSVLELYTGELKYIKPGRDDAHKYHLLASRIFYQIFANQLDEPVIEREINDGKGRIDITYRNKNKDGIFKDVKDLRDILCPEIIVECKNYTGELGNEEYAQINERLSSSRGLLGFLLCRDKIDEKEVLSHCRYRFKHSENKKYIIVLDDKDLIHLSQLKIDSEDDSAINDFIDFKIKQIVD